jgi:hypothetical protein
MEYQGKHIYLDSDGVMKYIMNDKPVKGDAEEKQPFILPGIYDGLWGAYYLEIIFDNEKKSEPIKTIEGVRGMNCSVKVIVTNDGTIFLE